MESSSCQVPPQERSVAEQDGAEGDDNFVSYETIHKEATLILKVLNALKEEYLTELEKALRETKKSEGSDFIKLHVEKSLERINLAMGEVEILVTLAEYLQYLEIDKLRVDMLLSCLQSENGWLKQEYTELYDKTATIENVLAGTDAERLHFNFLYQSRKNEAPTKQKETVIDHEKDDMDNDVPMHLRAIYNLILEYSAQGRYEVAIGLCNRAITDIKATQGETLDLAVMLNILALVNRDKGDYKEAVTSLQETLRIREKIMGPASPLVAATLNNLSVLLGKRGKFKEAEPVCRRALKIREEQLGVNHPDVAKQLNNLALILQNLKKPNEIEDLYKRAIQIYTDCPDKSDINLLKTQNNLAAFYIRVQNYPSAVNVLKRIMTKYHEDQMLRGQTKNLKPLWQFMDQAVAQGMKPQQIMSKFPSFGNVTNPVVKNTMKYYSSICKRMNKEKEAILMDKYVEWCNSGGKSRFDAEQLYEKEQPNAAAPAAGNEVTTLQYKLQANKEETTSVGGTSQGEAPAEMNKDDKKKKKKPGVLKGFFSKGNKE